jgi:serine-type D-Ala-D-Ala carboxypeptidase (penicillin-binding protein 5/6)
MNRFLCLITAATLVATPLLAQEEGPATAKGAAVDTTGKGYSAAYVLETSTHRVLFEENAHAPLPTASMSKMMTALLTMEEIRDGQLKLSDSVRISARSSKMGGSQIFAKEGQEFSVQMLLATLMVQSANDSAEALAERIGGSVENFVDRMNDRARQLGLKETRFYDPHGLPNSGNPQQINTMSAHDLAILGMELMKYPLMREYAKTAEMPFTNGTFTAGIVNPNHMINPHKQDYFADATGIKTGYSAPAGYCVTASAKRGNMELICVVMGAKHASGPESSFGIASRLMSNTFADWRLMEAVKPGQTVGQTPVIDGQAGTVAAVATGEANVLVKRGEEGSFKVAFAASGVAAPIRKGQPLGTVAVQQNGQTVARAPVVAANAVGKNPWWKKYSPF